MSRSILLGAAALAVAAAAPLTPVIAQGDADRADSTAITVYAPIRETRSRSPNGTVERTLVSSSSVYFGDLNLRSQWGRDQLDDRIKLAAEERCDLLEDAYPLERSTNGKFDCVRRAVNNAQPQVYSAVASYDGGAYGRYYSSYWQN